MPVIEFCKQMRFFLFVLMGNVNDRYDCASMLTEPKPIRKRTGPLSTQANLRSRSTTGLIGLQFGTWVNVASGEFRGSSHDTSFLSVKKFRVNLRREIS